VCARIAQKQRASLPLPFLHVHLSLNPPRFEKLCETGCILPRLQPSSK
jgi:hypothetical protein